MAAECDNQGMGDQDEESVSGVLEVETTWIIADLGVH